MKLWLVVYIFGKVALSVGPLPYGMDECRERAAGKSAEFDEGFVRNEGKAWVLDGKTVRRDDVDVRCLEAAERPALEDFKTEVKDDAAN